MNVPVIAPVDTLPVLIDRATAALDNARDSAAVLEARDMARAAYDAAKSAGRIAKAKQAHDSIISDVHRAQAHALAIRARAEMRLAEEYDAAQDRGEVQRHGGQKPRDVLSVNIPSASEVGIARRDIHEARQLRDAERESPGLIQRTLDSMIERGEEPTRAALKREVIERPQPKRMNQTALWLWGRIKDFERMGVLTESPGFLVSEMTDPMRADMRQLLPAVRSFLDMNQRQKITEQFERQYLFLSGAITISPSVLAHSVFERFKNGEVEPHIQYTSLEHLKQMAREFLRHRKDAEGDLSEAYASQGDLDLGVEFSGKLQDRYPLPRKKDEEPVYKLRSELTPIERAWNVQQLRKSAHARLEHADALEAEGQVLGAA